MLRPYSPMPTIAGTVEITDFIEAEFTGKGIGSKMLEYLLGEAGKKGTFCSNPPIQFNFSPILERNLTQKIYLWLKVQFP